METAEPFGEAWLRPNLLIERAPFRERDVEGFTRIEVLHEAREGGAALGENLVVAVLDLLLGVGVDDRVAQRATVVGGGAVGIPVFYNGSAWKCL